MQRHFLVLQRHYFLCNAIFFGVQRHYLGLVNAINDVDNAIIGIREWRSNAIFFLERHFLAFEKFSNAIFWRSSSNAILERQRSLRWFKLG